MKFNFDMTLPLEEARLDVFNLSDALCWLDDFRSAQVGMSAN